MAVTIPDWLKQHEGEWRTDSIFTICRSRGSNGRISVPTGLPKMSRGGSRSQLPVLDWTRAHPTGPSASTRVSTRWASASRSRGLMYTWSNCTRRTRGSTQRSKRPERISTERSRLRTALSVTSVKRETSYLVAAGDLAYSRYIIIRCNYSGGLDAAHQRPGGSPATH